jgi:hypothetical protein
MSAAGKSNSILIVGVLMLGAYIVMRPKQAQAQKSYGGGNRPTSMPASVGSGVAQVAVGAISSWLTNLTRNNATTSADQAMFANRILESDYLIADHLQPQESIQDYLSTDNWSGMGGMLA